MAITKIDRTVLRTLEPAVLAKLNETLGKDFGLHFDFKGGNFDREGKYAVLKLEIAVVSADGVVVDKARADWNQYAELYDCDAKWIDQTFTTADRKTFKVIGLLTKKRKNCVSIVNVNNGEKRICSPTMVRQYLGGSKRVVAPVVANLPQAAAPATADEKREVEKRIAQMKADGPENYYADGELKAAGMSERAIYNMHFDSILKQLRAEKNGTALSPMRLFIAPR
jgi:hypothetical protein